MQGALRLRTIGAAVLSTLLSVAAAAQEVPPVAPDSIPSDLLERADLVERDGGQRISTSVLLVLFDRSAGRTERQAAVDRVKGLVIGGVVAATIGDGIYLIQVPGDSTLATIDSLKLVLGSLPQVLSASRLSVGGLAVN